MYFVNLNKEKKQKPHGTCIPEKFELTPSNRRKITEVNTVPKPGPKAKEKLLEQGGEDDSPRHPA